MNRNWSAPSGLWASGQQPQQAAANSASGGAEYTPAVSGYTAGWNDPPKLAGRNHALRPTSVTPQPAPLCAPLPALFESAAGPELNGQQQQQHCMPHVASAAAFVNNGADCGADDSVRLEQLDASMRCPAMLQRIEQHVAGIQGAARGNIERRLPRLRNALAVDGALSDGCRRELSRLVCALDAGAYDLAYSVHSSMMLQYYGEVSQWMVAVKAIVLEMKKACNQL